MDYRKQFVRHAGGVILVLMLFGIGGFVFVRDMLEEARAPTRALWDQVKNGDDETTVRSLLGMPKYEYERKLAPAD